ncbi:MAG: hypothetical protein WBQ04_09595, partial [Candidatus Acidiferrales bacterium]
ASGRVFQQPPPVLNIYFCTSAPNCSLFETNLAVASLLSGASDGFEWNFSFGNGFEGTNLLAKNLHVIDYYASSAAKIHTR